MTGTGLGTVLIEDRSYIRTPSRPDTLSHIYPISTAYSIPYLPLTLPHILPLTLPLTLTHSPPLTLPHLLPLNLRFIQITSLIGGSGSVEPVGANELRGTASRNRDEPGLGLGLGFGTGTNRD